MDGPLILKLEMRKKVMEKNRARNVVNMNVEKVEANMAAVKDAVSMIEKAEANTDRNTKKGFPIKTVNAMRLT